MNIAIIGWGSLLWNRGVLSVLGDWRPDGPWLPLEFARISTKHEPHKAKSQYLSLVLYEDAGLIRTYSIKSGKVDLNEARENLRERERCNINSVGFMSRDGSSHFEPMDGLDTRMSEWLAPNHEFDGVIWTDLRSNCEKETGNAFTVENGIKWLGQLRQNNKHDEAERYVRMAPRQTDTCLRKRARELFAWTDLESG